MMLKYRQLDDNEWKEMIELYYRSGMSVVNFCKVHSLERNKFYDKKKEFDSVIHEQPIEVQFVEVVPPQVVNTTPIKLVKHGFEIEVSKDMDKTLLKELLGVINDL